MQNEELEYQKFLTKSLKAGREFEIGYKNLSQKNKLKFQEFLKTYVASDTVVEIIRFFQK